MTVKSGATIILPVTASGVPTPTVSWSLNDEPLTVAGDVSIDTKDCTSTVTVRKITSVCAGTYKVSAENEVGSDTAEFVVNVKGMLIIHVCVLPLVSLWFWCDRLLPTLLFSYSCYFLLLLSCSHHSCFYCTVLQVSLIFSVACLIFMTSLFLCLSSGNLSALCLHICILMGKRSGP